MSNELSTESSKVILELISYNKESHDKYVLNTVDEVLTNFKQDRINWINLDGLTNTDLIGKLQNHFNLHSLLIDDILSEQRPKVEEFEEYLFFTLKMPYRINGPEIDYEQISFVLGNNYLLSFQEKEGDLFDAFRERIRLDQGRVRKKQADYLLYRLIDIITDSYYDVLDNIGSQLDEIEECIHTSPSGETFNKIQLLKKELVYLHKALYPLRDALSKILKDESNFINEENTRYFTDLYDHVVNLIDSLDTYRDLAADLVDLHLNTQNTKLNEVIRLLTIISTIFIPLTFIVGVYGMNFEYFPELKWKYSYYYIWGIMLLIAGSMITFFRYKKWL